MIVCREYCNALACWSSNFQVLTFSNLRSEFKAAFIADYVLNFEVLASKAF